MSQLSTKSAYWIAVLGGSGLWLLTMAASGKREAWDSSFYWLIAYPLSITLAGVLSWHAPSKTWRWALATMLAQAVTLALTGGSFGLLPLGMIVFAVLALPAIAVGRIAAARRQRRERAIPGDRAA